MVSTNLKHLAELSVTMRQEDKDEIWHLARLTPLKALEGGYKACSYNRTVLLDGKVALIFGVAGEKGGVGVPWMLASPLLQKVRKPFLREAKSFLEEMSEGFSSLHNIAWSKNTEHLRWLKWMGFTFLPAVPMGPDGELFIEFHKVT